MSLWLAPLLAVYTDDAQEADTEFFTRVKNAGVDDATVNAKCHVDNFTKAAAQNLTPNRGYPLLALIHGVYDDADRKYYRRVQHFSNAGALVSASSIDTSSAGLAAFQNGVGGEHIFDIRPNSVATSETSVMIPLAIVSVKHGSALQSVKALGSNGLASGNGQYTSQAAFFTQSNLLSPAVQNVARNVQLWLEAPDVPFIKKDGDTVADATGYVSGLVGSSTNSTSSGLEFASGEVAPNNVFGGNVGNPSSKLTSDHIPQLEEVKPGDFVPFAVVLLGVNFDLTKYNSGGDYTNLPASILSNIKIRMQFDKVDMVPDEYADSIRVNGAGVNGWTLV